MQQGLTRLIGSIPNRGSRGSELVVCNSSGLSDISVYVHEKCYINTNGSHPSFRVFTVLLQSFVSNSFWLVSFWNFWNLMFLRKDNCVEFLQYATLFKFRQCWILWKCKKPVKNAGLCKDLFGNRQNPSPNLNL